MEELANAINDTRLSVSKALNGMQESGLPVSYTHLDVYKRQESCQIVNNS